MTATKLSNPNPKEAIGATKLPLHLCSPVAMAHWSLAQYAGLIKYGAWNWREAGVRASTYIAAMLRHIEAYSSGEEHDPVDGTYHLGNIMACASILMEARVMGKLTDDRAIPINFRPEWEEAQNLMSRLVQQYADYLPGGPKAPHHHTRDNLCKRKSR